MLQSMVYDIQRMSTQDGPGVRTTVFLKGCPLRCAWCSNPESQQKHAQLLYFESLCTGCGFCAQACPNNAITVQGAKASQQHEKCDNCGKCVPVCLSKARDFSGRLMSAQDIMDVVVKDALFYTNSDGGVTIGGGEPTMHGEFLISLLSEIANEGFHLALDTCGFCSQEMFDSTLKYTDLYLFDCKHMDSDLHKKLTGVDNKVILQNLSTVLSMNKEVFIRMPLIPDYNDTESNIATMATFLGNYGKKDIDIMPYHAFGQSKYAALGLASPTFTPYTAEHLEIVKSRFAKHGLTASLA